MTPITEKATSIRLDEEAASALRAIMARTGATQSEALRNVLKAHASEDDWVTQARHHVRELNRLML